MNELFREIEEEMKRERFKQGWNSFGHLIIWLSIGVVVATTLFVVWNNYTQRHAEEKTGRFLLGVSRLDSEDYKGAVSIFSELADDESSPYYRLAMLRKAQAQELSGDAEGAKKTYETLAKGEAAFSDLAKLKAAGKDGFVEVAPNSPFYYTMVEYNAWQLLRTGKNAEAADAFAALVNDKKTPNSMVARVSEVLRVIAPEKLMEKKVANE
jgi:hypothetical protein